MYQLNFKEVKRGYAPNEVDDYITSLERMIASYKEKDDAIKNAIVSAQLAADNIIKNAKAQADEYRLQIGRELERMRSEIERGRVKIQEFYEMYANVIRKYFINLDNKAISDLNSCLNEIDRLVDRLSIESDFKLS